MSLTETEIKAFRVPEREHWVNDGAGLVSARTAERAESLGVSLQKAGKTCYTTLANGRRWRRNRRALQTCAAPPAASRRKRSP